MDNNNQQNLNTPQQSPIDQTSSSVKLSNKIIVIIGLVIFAIIAIMVSYFFLKKSPSVSTNTPNNVPTQSVNTGYEKSSLSWAYVYGPENGKVKVYLYAPNQTSTINQNPWGFAFEGDTIISGQYKLIMDSSTEEDGLGGGWSSAQIDIGELQFNPKRPLTDGKLQSLQLDQNGYQDSLAIYQYGSSNTDVVYIYRYLSDKFSLVHFIPKNGKAENFTETGLGAELQSNSDGTFTSVWYDNTRGYVTTKWGYNYTDNNLHEIETKISQDPLASQNISNQNTIIVPALFSGIKWQEMPFDPSKIMDFQMAYDDFKYIQEPAKRHQKIIQLPGHLWVATVKNLSDSQLNDTREKFQKYYDDSLKGTGWDWQQDFDSKHISFSGPSADGALGSIWGYVKIQNEKLRLIGLGYQIKDYIDVSNGGPIEIKCPCTLELKVFVSDESNVNNFSL